MEKITFTNSQGLSVEIGTDGPFILRKVEGAGAVTATINAQKAPYQDGTTYIDNVLEPRLLSIELTILAESGNEMAANRRELAQAFNPKLGPGLLKYEIAGSSYIIEAVAELAPVFPHAAPFESVMQPGLISLYCSNPFWQDEERIIDLTGGSQIIVDNVGDVEAPPTFAVYGPAVNPHIENLTTGKSISLVGELAEGEQINITTAQGEKAITLIDAEGEQHNVFHWYNDTASEFFRLTLGINVLRYTGGDLAELIFCSLFVGV